MMGTEAGSSATKLPEVGTGKYVGLISGSGFVAGDGLGGRGGAGNCVATGIIEYLSIWPKGAAEAVRDSFSLSDSSSVAWEKDRGILGTAGDAGAPQLTGLRLISVCSESFAVAGAKKL